jgi:hypothetical protein
MSPTDWTNAKILLLIRDNIANDIEGLCDKFGIDIQHDGGYIAEINNSIGQLLQAKLIKETTNGHYEVSKNWEQAYVGLGYPSLHQIAEITNVSKVITPYNFGTPSNLRKSDLRYLFVVMPFDDKLNPIASLIKKKVAPSLDNIKAKRGDDLSSPTIIMADVWNLIYQAHAIIADCTGQNANVFYEIGLAHAIGKEVILITQNKKDIPFDISNIRYITYKNTPKGRKTLAQKLIATLKTVLDLDENP